MSRPAEGAARAVLDAINSYRTDADKLAEHWGVRDELAARIQLGTVPAPDPAAFNAGR